jgi:hypothetical protein
VEGIVSEKQVAERRSHPRRETELQLHVTPEEGGVVARMVASNLSAGGLYCTSSADFEEMTRLAVRLLLPVRRGGDGETEPLDLEAVVVRRRELPSQSNGETRYELALFFTTMKDHVRQQLLQYLG